MATMTVARLDTHSTPFDSTPFRSRICPQTRFASRWHTPGICLTDIHFMSGEPKFIPGPPCRTTR